MADSCRFFFLIVFKVFFIIIFKYAKIIWAGSGSEPGSRPGTLNKQAGSGINHSGSATLNDMKGKIPQDCAKR